MQPAWKSYSTAFAWIRRRGHCVFILPNLLVVCRIRKAFFLSSHKVKVCLQCLQKKRRGGQTWRDFLLIHLYVCLTFHTFLFLKGFFCPLEVHYIGHELDFILGKNANVYFSWDRKSFQYSNMWLEVDLTKLPIVQFNKHFIRLSIKIRYVGPWMPKMAMTFQMY